MFATLGHKTLVSFPLRSGCENMLTCRPVDNCTSVFRVTDLNNSEVWQLVVREVDSIRDKPSLARAEIEVVRVTKVGLTVRETSLQ
jgi:hypothetical protein